MFGEKNRLLAAAVTHQRISETVNKLRSAGLNDRAEDIQNGKAFKDAETRALHSASRLYAMDAEAQSRGLNIDLAIESQMRRLMDAKQLALAAEFSGVSEKEIEESATKSALMQYEREKHAELTAQSLFYTASCDEDIELNASTVLNALVRERARILTFSNVIAYLGDLALLKRDIDTLEVFAAHESEHEDENNGAVDNQHVSGEELLTTLRQKYKTEVANEKKRNVRRVKKAEAKQAEAKQAEAKQA